MANLCDFDSFLRIFEQKGRELYGQHFKIHAPERDLFQRMYVYFFRDKHNAELMGIDLDKGIMLNGPVGSGKTSLLTIFRELMPKERRYAVKSCREVSFEFIDEGFATILRYSRYSFNKTVPRIVCFDDLGTERTLKFYGNECNVIGEILLSRYDYFISNNMLTYITTNLNSDEIEEIYGLRVRSRMRKMCNLLSFERETTDKRK